MVLKSSQKIFIVIRHIVKLGQLIQLHDFIQLLPPYCLHVANPNTLLPFFRAVRGTLILARR